MNKIIKWFLIIALFLGIFSALAYWYITKQFDNTKEIKSNFSVNTNIFNKEFEENDSLANLKYKNKTIELTGKIKEIKLTDSLAVVVLQSDSSEIDIICDFQTSSITEVKNLKVDSFTTIKGICSGMDNTKNTIETADDMSMLEDDDEGSMLDDIKTISMIRCTLKNYKK